MVAQPTLPTAPAVGDPVLASYGDEVAQWITILANPPLYVGYQTSVQSLANAATVPILMDSENDDTYNGHSTTVNTDRYTAQLAGYYMIYGAVQFGANATGQRAALIQKNGTAFVPVPLRTQVDAASAGATEVPTSALLYLNVGDYVQLCGIQTSGGALNTVASGSWMYAYWVHA